MKNNRIEQLTFTRFIAAIAIVIFHFGKGVFPFNNHSISFIFEQANYGVSYFFVLSGFVMMMAYGNKGQIDVFRFLKKRFARIYPVYFLALFLCILIFFSIGEVNYENVFLNLFLIQSWVPGKATSLNFPGWSLSVELFFYLSFPFLFNWVYRKFSYKQLIPAGLMIWLISQLLFHFLLREYPEYRPYFYYQPLLHLNEFILGSLGGLYFLNFSSIKFRYFELFTIMIIGIILLALKFPFGINYHNGFLGLLFLPLIIFMSHSRGTLTRFFRNRLFVFLGEISYSIYILQFPVWLLISDYRLNKYFNIDKHSDLNFYVKMLLLVLLSALTYVIIERPFRNLIVKLKFRSGLNTQLSRITGK